MTRAWLVTVTLGGDGNRFVALTPAAVLALVAEWGRLGALCEVCGVEVFP